MIHWEHLSDLDVENVVRDLCAAEWDVHVESFRRGPDDGIDLRASGPIPNILAETRDVIIGQVKHYPNASISRVLTAFRKEANREGTAKADIYVAITTARLSVLDKEKISAELAVCKRPAIIFGREDLEGLLQRHRAVYRKYFQLWLCSSDMIETILRNKERLRQGLLFRRIDKEAPLLVQTSFFVAASKVLSTEGTVILSGGPGVGKSTTALLLILDLMKRGWEPVVAVNRLEDAESLLDPTKKQVVFYDDFLGRSLATSFLDKNEDRLLYELIVESAENPNLKLVLTTREYILSSAKMQYERLDSPRIDLTRVLVEARRLSYDERAEMIYRQLYNSEFYEVLEARPSTALWVSVVGHRNFNPRLCRMYRDDLSRRVKGKKVSINGEEYIAGLISTLDDPSELWRHLYESQLSVTSRCLLQTLFTMAATYPSLEDVVIFAASWQAENNVVVKDEDWISAIRLLDGDLVAISGNGKIGNVLTFANQSIGDYIAYRLQCEPKAVLSLLNSAVLFLQVQQLWQIARRWFDESEQDVLRDSFTVVGKPGMQGADFRSVPLEEWQEGFSRAIARTFPRGHYSGHPAWGGRPGRWKGQRPYAEVWITDVIDIMETLSIENEQIVDLVAAVTVEQLDTNKVWPDPVLGHSYMAVRSTWLRSWSSWKERLLGQYDAIVLNHVKFPIDFEIALDYIRKTDRESDENIRQIMQMALRRTVDEILARRFTFVDYLASRREISPSGFAELYRKIAIAVGLPNCFDLTQLRTALHEIIAADQSLSLKIDDEVVSPSVGSSSKKIGAVLDYTPLWPYDQVDLREACKKYFSSYPAQD